MAAERVLTGLLLGAIALGCGYVLYPFFSAILWAGILVFSTWPLFRRLRRAGIGRSGAASIMIALATVLVVLPLALAVPDAVKEVTHLRGLVHGAVVGGLPPAPTWLADMPIAGKALAELWNGWAADLGVMGTFFRPYLGMIIEASLGLLLGIARGITEFLLALFIGFFFYLYGESLAGQLQAILRRLAGDRAERLLNATGIAVRGTVYGILGTAIIQGILTFIGLWIAEMPRASLLALVAGFLAVLPIGAPLIWIPSAIWLLASGQTAHGIFLVAYGVIAVSGSDHVIRPYFIARGAQLPFLLTVLGVLGGALAYGLLGIFLGPVLLGVGLTLVNEFALDGERQPAPITPFEPATLTSGALTPAAPLPRDADRPRRSGRPG